MRLLRRRPSVSPPSVTTQAVTLGLYLEALFVANVNEDEAFDPSSEDVSVETCRRLCLLLFESFPAEATPEAVRLMATAGWAALGATKAEALAWARTEQAILTSLWGPPEPGPSLPLTDYLLNLGDDAALVGYCALLDRPLWQAFLFLYCRGIVADGHRTNAEMKRRAAEAN